MSQKSHKNKLLKTLKNTNLYTPKLDMQIELTSMQLDMLDHMLAELENGNMVEVEISAAGTEKKTLSPLIPYIEKLFGQITESYKSLGLNFNAKASNVKESTENPEQSQLSQLINTIQNGR